MASVSSNLGGQANGQGARVEDRKPFACLLGMEVSSYLIDCLKA